jgi:hypothetical protein
MASPDPFLEAERFEKLTNPSERNVRVGRPEEHPFEQPAPACHSSF